MKQILRAIKHRLLRRQLPLPERRERLMYRVYLFEELVSVTGEQFFRGKRILEIGPKDGLDSKRLASLEPSELVMIDLPEKRDKVDNWLPEIQCRKRFLEANFMYMPPDEYRLLGKFSLIWCTGVLYHNAEQLRFLRKLYRLLDIDGYLVLESATLRLAESLRDGSFVEIHYPQTYRDTGTITHLPTVNAIKSWLQMAGFQDILDSSCHELDNKDLVGQRYACICRKSGEDDADIYYGKTDLNPKYRFGDST